jgi:hypothetical protein
MKALDEELQRAFKSGRSLSNARQWAGVYLGIIVGLVIGSFIGRLIGSCHP